MILASASPRRRKILNELGVAFDVEIPDVAEVCIENNPRRTACGNAERKLAWAQAGRPDAWIIAADTIIDFEGMVVNKPESLDEARGMFRRFSGRCHDVLTAVALYAPEGAAELVVAQSTVRFRCLTAEVIDRYFAEVDPLDKAGAYDIDQAPQEIIASFSGSRTNIMGLPVEIVDEWLRKQGIGVRG